MLTYKQAAKKINVSLSKLYLLMRAGEIQNVQLGPQVMRIPLSECEAYTARRIAESRGEGRVAVALAGATDADLRDAAASLAAEERERLLAALTDEQYSPRPGEAA